MSVKLLFLGVNAHLFSEGCKRPRHSGCAGAVPSEAGGGGGCCAANSVERGGESDRQRPPYTGPWMAPGCRTQTAVDTAHGAIPNPPPSGPAFPSWGEVDLCRGRSPICAWPAGPGSPQQADPTQNYEFRSLGAPMMGPPKGFHLQFEAVKNFACPSAKARLEPPLCRVHFSR